MILVSEKTKELVEKFYPTDSETVVLQLQDYSTTYQKYSEIKLCQKIMNDFALQS